MTTTLYFDNNQQVNGHAKLTGVRNAVTLAEYGEPEYSHTVDFDETSNAGILAAVDTNSLTYDVVTSTLYDADTPLVINADSEETTANQQLVKNAQTALAQITTDRDSIANALTLVDGANTAQLKAILTGVLNIEDRLLRNMEHLIYLMRDVAKRL